MITGSVTSLQPYIYHVGGLSSTSLDKVSSLPEDVLSGGTDFSGLVSEEENPLRRGETKGFMDIFAMQMQMGARHAAQLGIDSGQTEAIENLADADGDILNVQNRNETDVEAADKARALRNVSETVGDVNTTSTVQGAGEEIDPGMYGRTGNMAEYTPFRISQALNAYEQA